MNKEIKIIDLLNMIAERKELPEKIKYRDIEYERSYVATRSMYYYASENSNLLMEQLTNTIDLLSTVEIIEEDNNKIEKMKIDEVEDAEHLKFKEKINEIIDKINKDDRK